MRSMRLQTQRSKAALIQQAENRPSLQELARLFDCILLDDQNAGLEDDSLSGQHVLKPVATLME